MKVCNDALVWSQLSNAVVLDCIHYKENFDFIDGWECMSQISEFQKECIYRLPLCALSSKKIKFPSFTSYYKMGLIISQELCSEWLEMDFLIIRHVSWDWYRLNNVNCSSKFGFCVSSPLILIIFYFTSIIKRKSMRPLTPFQQNPFRLNLHIF